MYTIIAHIEYPERASFENYEPKLKNKLKEAGAVSINVISKDYRTAIGGKIIMKASSWKKHNAIIRYLKRLKFETIYSMDKNEITEVWVEEDRLGA